MIQIEWFKFLLVQLDELYMLVQELQKLGQLKYGQITNYSECRFEINLAQTITLNLLLHFVSSKYQIVCNEKLYTLELYLGLFEQVILSG